MHRWSLRNDDRRPSSAPDEFSIWCLETRFSRQRVPRLRSGVLMRWRDHAGIERCFHVLDAVVATGRDRDGPDLVRALADGWTPSFLSDSQQPHLSEGFHDSTARPLRGLGRAAGRVNIEMPEDLRVRELADVAMDDDPAADILDARPLADRTT